jgi:hypothetical protein
MPKSLAHWNNLISFYYYKYDNDKKNLTIIIIPSFIGCQAVQPFQGKAWTRTGHSSKEQETFKVWRKSIASFPEKKTKLLISWMHRKTNDWYKYIFYY